VKLCEHTGWTYRAAEEFIDQVTVIAQQEIVERNTLRSLAPRAATTSIKALRAFHNDPRYGADLHRADLAWAVHAASWGISEQQIKDQILYARDLSKKGRPQRQLDYAERTALKALAIVQPTR
jgi:hypothetical protein